MTDQVSKLAAFVFEHGEMAGEILFRDVESQGELPGVSAEEREAIVRAMPHLRETWIGILSACREEFWKLSAGHHANARMRSPKTSRKTMSEKRFFAVRLDGRGRATAGVTLAAWGQPQYSLHAWCWTQARYRARAEAALEALAPQKNGAGLLWLRLDPPAEGESYGAVGARAAEALWSLARPVANFWITFKAIEPPPELFGDEENE